MSKLIKKEIFLENLNKKRSIFERVFEYLHDLDEDTIFIILAILFAVVPLFLAFLSMIGVIPHIHHNAGCDIEHNGG